MSRSPTTTNTTADIASIGSFVLLILFCLAIIGSRLRVR